jgi:hypothetical protein
LSADHTCMHTPKLLPHVGMLHPSCCPTCKPPLLSASVAHCCDLPPLPPGPPSLPPPSSPPPPSLPVLSAAAPRTPLPAPYPSAHTLPRCCTHFVTPMPAPPLSPLWQPTACSHTLQTLLHPGRTYTAAFHYTCCSHTITADGAVAPPPPPTHTHTPHRVLLLPIHLNPASSPGGVHLVHLANSD